MSVLVALQGAGGAVLATPDPVPVVLSVPVPVVTAGRVVTPDPVAVTLGVPAPSATAGRLVSPDPVALTLGVPAPAVTAGSLTAPAPVVLTLAVPVPTVTATGVPTIVSPSPVVLTLTVPIPAVTAGVVGVARRGALIRLLQENERMRAQTGLDATNRPIVARSLYENLVRQYGPSEGKLVYFSMQAERKGPFAEGNKYEEAGGAGPVAVLRRRRRRRQVAFRPKNLSRLERDQLVNLMEQDGIKPKT